MEKLNIKFRKLPMKRATELEYLRYFYDAADFGPADSDVRWMIKEGFEKDTGKKLPVKYVDD